MSEKSLTRRTLASSGTRAALSLLTSVGLLVGPGGIVAVAPVAASNASSASLDQCANGAPSGSRQACTGSNWQNGNVNGNNSQYREGDSVPFRALITVPASTTAVTHHTIWVQYDSTVSSKHAYDYLTTWNRTETGDPTSGQTGISSTALPPTTAGADQIPPPIDLQATTCALVSARVPASPGVMTLYGPTGAGITGVTYAPAPGGTAEPTNCQGTSNSVTVQIAFDVPAASSGTAKLVLAWGGHIGTQQSWGTGNSAVAISGSPYHERILEIDTTSIGNQDRSLKASAVLVPPTIVTQVSPGGSNPSVAIGTSVTDLATVSGSAGTPTGTVAFSLCTSNCPSDGSGATPVGTGPVTLNNLGQATSPAVNTPTSPLAPGLYCFFVSYSPGSNSQYTSGTDAGNTTTAANECFTVAPNTPSVSTTMSATSPIAIGTSVHDSATITGATSTAGGTISYGLYSDSTCSTLVQDLTPTIHTVVNGVAPDSNSYQFNSAGTFYFQATYSGDANNTGPVSSSCMSETMVVSPNTPSVSTTMSATSPIAIGTSVHDSATITGATSTAGGTISYGLYSDSTCSTLVQDLTPTIHTVVNGVAPDSNSYQFNSAGTFYFQATYSGDANNTGPVSSSCMSETMVVSPNTPSVSTTMSATSPIAIGTSVHDSATITGATSTAGGTISYGLYSDSTCSTLVQDLTPTIHTVVNGVAPDSNSYQFNSAGTFYFQATYSGDANNTGPVSSSCMSETMVVSPNTPSVSTTMSATSPIAIGTSVHDSATITGATSTAGGTISYGLYSDSTCSTLVQDLTPTIHTVVNGVAPDSNSYQFNSAGTFYFQATYSGDANNTGPVSSSCMSETMVVSPNTPSVSTTMSATSPIAIGTSVHDSATITGATSTAGGTISYGLYSDSTCSTLVQDLTPTIHTVVNGVAPDSNSYQFNSAGTFYFQATYSGDANNTGPVSSSCMSETMVVSPNTPSVSTTMSATSPIAIGTSVHDSATITGATSTAGGTISYGLYSDSTCSTLVQDLTPTIHTVVNGVAPDSNSYQFNSAGTFYFQATYSGDANNTGPVSSSCMSETMVVNGPPVGLIAPTNTTCQMYLAGAPALPAIYYSVNGAGKINQNVNPGVFFYFSTVTVTAGQTVQTSQEQGGAGPFLLNQGHAVVYDQYCNKVGDMTPTAGGATASFQFQTAGTYILQLQYSTKSIAGNAAPAASTVTYGLDTDGFAEDDATVSLVRQ